MNKKVTVTFFQERGEALQERWLKAKVIAILFFLIFNFGCAHWVRKNSADDLIMHSGLAVPFKQINQKIRKDKNNYSAYCDRGHTYLAVGAYKRAAADYSRAVQINPKKYEAYFYRARACDELGQLKRALRDYTKAIELNGPAYRLYQWRGQVYAKQGKWDLAIADFTKSIKLSPEDMLGYLDRARAYKNRGDLDPALADYDKVLKLNPTADVVYEERAVIYFMKKDFDKSWENVRILKQWCNLEITNPKFMKKLKQESGRSE